MTPRGHPCPWCDSVDTERLGDAGSLLMTDQWFCNACGSAFETIRKRGDEPAAADPGTVW